MTDYSFKNNKESIDYVINRLIEMESKLNEWESGFVYNLKHKRSTYTGGYELSERQLDVLSSMWERY